MKNSLRNRLYAWWYFSIAAGFVLLNVKGWMMGEKVWLIWLRFAISAGFVVLGWITIRGK